MLLLLLQVEDGLCEGAVLYHAHISRSKAEVAAQQAAKDEVARLKSARRRQQDDNVRRKQVRCRLGYYNKLCPANLIQGVPVLDSCTEVAMPYSTQHTGSIQV